MNRVVPVLMVGGELHGNWAAVPEDPGRRWKFALLDNPLRALTESEARTMPSYYVTEYTLTMLGRTPVLLRTS